MDAGLLVLRLTVGLIVAGHGAQKLWGWFGGGGLDPTAKHLDAIGLRPARAWALAGGSAEFFGGLLLALGLAAPLGSIGVCAAMAVAVTKVHWPKFWAQQGGFEFALVNFAGALAVGLAGVGAYALDAVLHTALPAAAVSVLIILAAVGYLAAMVGSAAASHKPAAPSEA